MSRIYLVRHGVHSLVDKALAGRMPGIHLSEQGRTQAARLAGHFGDLPVARILASPLERCRETADPIATRLGLAVGLEPALLEIDCGAWTGASFDALARDPRWHAWNAERERSRIPDGESATEVRARVRRLLDRLAAEDAEPALLVSHSDVIKAAVLTILGASLDHYNRVAIDPASVTTVDLWAGGGTVVRLNEEAGA